MSPVAARSEHTDNDENGARVRPPVAIWAQRRPARRVVKILWSVMVGAVLAQSLLGGIIVLGWVQRFVRRRVLSSWWQASCHRSELAEIVAEGTARYEIGHWPNWFVREGGRAALRHELAGAEGFGAKLRARARLPVQSLLSSLALGLRTLLATSALILPPALLWTFAWYAGWDNSFNKGYERASVGILTGLLGIALFAVVMLYVPFAQARLAVSGDWRRFFDLRLVSCLVRSTWPSSLLLAALYALVSLPLTLLEIAPAFFSVTRPATLEMTERELLALLDEYFFWSAAFGCVGLLVVRTYGARLYARAVLRAVARGAVAREQLAQVEVFALDRLGLFEPQTQPPRSAIGRALGRGTTTAARLAGFAAAAALWATFAVQIFVGEFFNYQGPRGWLNQPLIQVPWFRYVPAELAEGLEVPRSQGLEAPPP